MTAEHTIINKPWTSPLEDWPEFRPVPHNPAFSAIMKSVNGRQFMKVRGPDEAICKKILDWWIRRCLEIAGKRGGAA